MERDERAMLERHEQKIKEYEELFSEHKTEIEKIKSKQLDQAEIIQELKYGVREINGTINSLSSSVGELKTTIVNDNEKTRSYFEESFRYIMGAKAKEQDSNNQLTMAKLGTKEKIVLGIIGLFGSGGFLVGLASFFTR